MSLEIIQHNSRALADYLAPYTGFVNPVLTPVYNTKGELTDLTVSYEDNYLEQMLFYGENYSFLTVR